MRSTGQNRGKYMDENKSEIIIYQSEDGLTHIDVRIEEDTVWLTQAQLVELYQTSKANISEHIKHILKMASWTKIQLFGISEQLPQTEKATTPSITIST